LPRGREPAAGHCCFWCPARTVLLFLPFGLHGYGSRDDVVRPIASALPRNVALVAAEIQFIDHAKRQVRTDQGS
jgi:hypothetical protein